MSFEKNSSRLNGTRKGQEGFSLLEVMVALGIFSVGIVTLLMVRGNSLAEAKMADQLNKARYLAANKMEEIVFGYTYVEDGESGDFEEEGGDVFPGFSWEVEVVDEEWGEILDEEDDTFGAFGDSNSSSNLGSTSGTSFQDFIQAVESGGTIDTKGGQAGQGGQRGSGRGGGLFGTPLGEEGAGGTEVLQKVTLTIYFPVGTEEQSLTTVTYIPIPEYITLDEDLMKDREKATEKSRKEQEREQRLGGRK